MSNSIYEPTRKLIETQFAVSWGSRTLVKYANVPFALPAKVDWVALNLIFGTSIQVSIGPTGSRMERHTGLMDLQVFSPQNTGSVSAYEHVDFASNAFRMLTLKDSNVTVVFRTPQVFNPGTSNEWFNLTMQVEFQVDAIF